MVLYVKGKKLDKITEILEVNRLDLFLGIYLFLNMVSSINVI
jgi:hypothetical protein